MSLRALQVADQSFVCEALIFDLDGTLVDTSQDLLCALNSSLQAYGEHEVAADAFCEVLHHGLERSVELIVADRGLSESRVRAIVSTYRTHYLVLFHANSVLYAGVAEFLRECQIAGYRLGVCTNKETEPAVHLLHKFGILSLFDVVLGIDRVCAPKPSAAPLQHILSHWRIPASRAVFVGDSNLDATASRHAGIRFVLHAAGIGAKSVNSSWFDARFDHYREIRVGQGSLIR